MLVVHFYSLFQSAVSRRKQQSDEGSIQIFRTNTKECLDLREVKFKSVYVGHNISKIKNAKNVLTKKPLVS